MKKYTNKLSVNFQPRYQPNGIVLFLAYLSTGRKVIKMKEQIVDSDSFGNPVYKSIPVEHPERAVVSTGITCPEKCYDRKNKRCNKPYAGVNAELEQFKRYVNEIYNKLLQSGMKLTAEVLAAAVKEYITKLTKEKKKSGKIVQIKIPNYFNEEITGIRTSLEDYISEQIEKIRKEGYFVHEKGDSTIEAYERFLSKVKRFNKEVHPIDLYNLNNQTAKSFVQFFLDNGKDPDKIKKGEDKWYKHNSLNEIKKMLKAFVNMAKKEGIPTQVDFSDVFWKNRWEKDNDPYLSFEELGKLRALKFDDEQKNLERVRDAFIVGCNSGMSVQDLKELKFIFHNKKDGWHFLYTRIKINRGQKLNQKIKVPIRQKYIIDLFEKKYKGEFNFEISEQNFNKHLKTICLLAGLKRPVENSKKDPKSGSTTKTVQKLYECVSSKTMRKTFASNEVLEYSTPLSILKRWTGHSSEAMLLNYIQLSEEDYYSIALRAVQLKVLDSDLF